METRNEKMIRVYLEPSNGERKLIGSVSDEDTDDPKSKRMTFWKLIHDFKDNNKDKFKVEEYNRIITENREDIRRLVIDFGDYTNFLAVEWRIGSNFSPFEK